MSPTTAAPTRRRSSGPVAPSAPAPRRRPAPPVRDEVATPRTRPRPTVRNGTSTSAPTRARSAAPTRARTAAPARSRTATPTRTRTPASTRTATPRTRRVAAPPAPPRRRSRIRVAAWVLLVATIVITIAGFHAVLAQTQVRLEQLRSRTAVAEARYEAQRLENGRLGSPARITARAAEMGLAPPAVAPVAVPLLGQVPRRGGASVTLSDWAEVKRHLDSSP